MTTVAEQQYERVGATKGCADHDHDLVQELNKRLDCLWRLDQYIANAAEQPNIQAFWRDLKTQEHENVGRLKELIAGEVQRGCF